jgi:hypothetical protein
MGGDELAGRFVLSVAAIKNPGFIRIHVGQTDVVEVRQR